MATTAQRMLDYQGEVFAPTADGIVQWVETTHPRPPDEAVREHVRWLDRERLISEDDLAKLAAAGYGI